jgi:magnesium transporter
MTIFIKGQRIDHATALPEGDAPAALFIPTSALREDAQALGLSGVLMPPLDESAANHFEVRGGYDCILLNMPDKSADIEAAPVNIDIYVQKDRLIFVHDPAPAIDRLMALLSGPATLPFDDILYTFFDLLTARDADALEAFEEEIAQLEDDITDGVDGDGGESLARISAMRKRLLKQKRYFESLIDTLAELTKNTGGFLSKAQLRALGIIASRADRQFHSVLNLRDYVTQVREAYQAQMDISLNRTMRLFTVLTAIFLPLTLLVGWYGMNLHMPEANSPHAYPVVIAISAVVVIAEVIYFKRRKWF